MNECDLSDAITETVAGALNKIKFEDGVEYQRGNDNYEHLLLIKTIL